MAVTYCWTPVVRKAVKMKKDVFREMPRCLMRQMKSTEKRAAVKAFMLLETCVKKVFGRLWREAKKTA